MSSALAGRVPQPARAAVPSRRPRRVHPWLLVSHMLLILGGITMVAPFLWMISTSLKEPSDVFAFPPQWIPHPVRWRNYLDAWTALPVSFTRFYMNSVFVAVCVTLGQLLTSSLAAFAFARLRFPGRDKLFFLYLGTLMIPGAVTMIPNFVLLAKMGLKNTYTGLIVPGVFTAYGTFLLRQFFMTLPTALEDAAKIDGCSYLGIWRRVAVPLSKPALATLGTFTFMGVWRDFLWPLIMIDSPRKMTLPLALSYFQGIYTTEWTLLMAASLFVMAPLVIVFLLNQRYFIESIRLTGIKG